MLARLTLGISLVAAMLAGVANAAPSLDLPPLSDAVRRDLLSRDPSEYQVSSLSSNAINRRGPPNGLTGLKTRCTASHCFAFTFDDGPYESHKTIADRLNNEGYKGTFFVNGNNYRCIYDSAQVSALRHSYAQGHQICSHTWGHVHLNDMSNAQIDEQVQLVEDALWKIIGAVPSCIRPPYGEANQRVVDYLNNRWGLVVINWTDDSRDSLGASVEESKNVYRSLKSPKHAIVLNHETVSTTPNQLLPAAIGIVKQNGYVPANVQTVPALMGFNGYKVRGQRGSRDASWTCNGKPQPGQG